MEGALTWRPLAEADLPLLARWLAEPLVARWWNHEASPGAAARDFGPALRGEEPGENLIVALDGRPFGLLQRQRLADYPSELALFEAVTEVPPESASIDYLIGEPDLRGRGLGVRLIASAVREVWREHPAAPAVLVAVVAGNVGSWRALEAAGFRRVGEADMSPENPLDGPLHVVYRIDRPGEAST